MFTISSSRERESCPRAVDMCLSPNSYSYRKEERTGLNVPGASPGPLAEGGLRQSDQKIGRLSDFIGEVAS